VVIGRREEGQKPGGSVGLDETRAEAEEAEGLLGLEGGRGGEVELDDTLLAVDGDGSIRDRRSEEHRRLKRAEEADDPL
jgi:hypothetical protein